MLVKAVSFFRALQAASGVDMGEAWYDAMVEDERHAGQKASDAEAELQHQETMLKRWGRG